MFNCISYYINTYNTLDKAGSYGIQDYSAIFVEKINGCYDNDDTYGNNILEENKVPLNIFNEGFA